MAKAKTTRVALQFGHATPFRRTITVGKESKTLLFTPGEMYELPAAEAKQLEREFAAGILIDPDNERRYANAPTGDPNVIGAEAASEIAKLTELIAERDAKIAELKQQVADYDELIEAEGGEDDETEGEDDGE